MINSHKLLIDCKPDKQIKIVPRRPGPGKNASPSINIYALRRFQLDMRVLSWADYATVDLTQFCITH